jgi:ligand-binding sensor domain-containing protein/signal transduction histidine kinase
MPTAALVAQVHPFSSYGSAQGLPENAVTSLAQDERGFLWIGTSENGVARYDGRAFLSFTAYEAAVPARVQALCAGPGARLFIGSDQGLHCLLLGENGDDVADAATNARLRKFKHSVSALRLRDGILHITAKTGTFRLSLSDFSVIPAPWPEDTATGRAARLLAPRRVVRAVRDLGGNLWADGDGGLFRIEGTRALRMNRANGFTDDAVTALLLDDEGTLWCGTARGLYSHVPHRFVQFPEGREIPKDAVGVWSIAETQQGDYWIGTIGAGALLLRGEKSLRRLDRKSGLPSNAVSTIVNEGDGVLLFATLNGIARLTQQSVEPALAAVLPDRNVEHIVPARSGGYWICTRGGLFRARDASLRSPARVRGLPSQRVTAVAEDASGRLWIATRGGAAVLLPGADSSDAVDGLRNVRMTSVFVDTTQDVFFGSMGRGLFILHRGTLRSLSREDGLAGNTVYFIERDADGGVCLGTNGGVTVLRGSDLYTWTTAHGLVNNEMNSGAVLRDRRGSMWFGSIGGVTRLQSQRAYREYWTAHFQRNGESGNVAGEAKRRIMLSALSIDGHPVTVDSSMHIDADGFIEVRLLRPTFRNPGQARFEYALSGDSISWHTAQDGVIRIAGLAPGTRALSVRMSIGDGLWTTAQQLAVLHVAQPWYRSLVFWIGVLVCSWLLGWGVYRYRMAHALRLERMRTRIAGDLHDEIGVNLSTIGLLASLELRQHSGQTASEGLAKIADLARRTSLSMSDIVWSVNPAKDEGGALFDRLTAVAESLVTPDGLELSLAFDEQLRRRVFQANERRELILICREALSNVQKHSGCTELRLSLEAARGRIVFSVADNGSGFDLSKPRQGHGVGGMRARAERMGWTFALDSGADGTCITVTMPE